MDEAPGSEGEGRGAPPAARLLAAFNDPATPEAERARLLARLLGDWNGAVIRPPLAVTSGRRIRFEEACFVGEGCTIDDSAEVVVGAFTQLARGVRIRTADPAGGPARGVRIGRNVWIGAGAEIGPGVAIGDDAIVSAGARVLTDVPEGATAAGDPARITR